MPVLSPRRAFAGTPAYTFSRPSRGLLCAFGILLLYLFLALGNAFTAVPWCDEAWLSNPALTFLRKGYLGTPILTEFGWGPPESLLHIQQRTYWIMPLHMVMQIGWYRVFGYSLLSLRCLSIMWGAVALAALASIVWKLTGDTRTALVAALIAGTDYFYLTRAIDGRMDMMAAASMLCGLAAYLGLRERNLTRAVAVAGICAAAAFFTHPVGGFFALCGLGVTAFYYDRKRLRIWHAALFSIPFLLIGAAWGVYIAQDVPAFRMQMAGNAHGRWEGITNLPKSVYGELRFKYFQAFGLNSFTELSLQDLRLLALVGYAASCVAVARTRALRASAGNRLLLWITFVFVVGGMLFDGAKRWYYLLYVVPFFTAVMAVWCLSLWETRRRWRPALATAFGIFIAIQAGGTLYRMQRNDYKNKYLPAVAFLQAHNPRRELINGEGEAGFAMGFPDNLIDDVSLGYFSHRKSKLIFVPDTYWGLWLGNMMDRDPAVGRHIAYTFSHDYRLAFKNNLYSIYERNDEKP